MKKVCLLIGLLALAVQIVVGCGAPDRVPQAATQPTPALPTAVALAGDRLYIRDGYGSDREHVAIVDSISGDRAPDLPFGVVARDWSVLYAVEQRDGQTRVRALNPQTGRVLRETTLEGAYDLPRISPDGMPSGLSPDGGWLALETTPAPEDGTWRSHLVVLDTTFVRPPRLVDLAGNFWFDGLSTDGSALYLIEKLPPDQPAEYKVRLYEMAQGALAPKEIADKAGDEIMSGIRQDAIPSFDGSWLFSLYLNDSGPFIHALNLSNRFAFCIDLPRDAEEDPIRQSMWSLTMSPNGKLLYAANGALGLVAEVDTEQLQVRRTVRLAPPAASSGVAIARAGERRVGGAAVAPDGKTLFTLGEQGLLAIDLADLKLRDHYLADWTLDSVAVSQDGKRLYGVSAGQGKLMQLDSSTGAVMATISGGERPWRVLRVEPRALDSGKGGV